MRRNDSETPVRFPAAPDYLPTQMFVRCRYGEEMTEAERDGVVQETRDAFTHNAALILEQPSLVSSGLLGGCRLVGGYAGAAISGKLT